MHSQSVFFPVSSSLLRNGCGFQKEYLMGSPKTTHLYLVFSRVRTSRFRKFSGSPRKQKYIIRTPGWIRV